MGTPGISKEDLVVAYHLLSLRILPRNVSHMPKSVSVTKQDHLEGQLSIFFVFQAASSDGKLTVFLYSSPG